MKVRRPAKQSRSLRLLAVRLGTAILSCALLVAALETIFRLVPTALPRGAYYGSGRYDSQLGFFLPASAVIYRGDRYVVRRPNGDGMLDVAHAHRAPPGTRRVGIFGDSFVASVEVPLDEVFFRLLPTRVGDHRVEYLAFGRSGLGTLHSLQLYRKFADSYDLDHVVYLFVANDPSDNSSTLSEARRGLSTQQPTASLSEEVPGYAVKAPAPEEQALWRRGLRGAKTRSLLARVLHGLSARATPEPRPRLDGGAGRSAFSFNQPESWPVDWRREAETLTERILAQFRREVEDQGRSFWLFYVPPRRELHDPETALQGWRPWLESWCRHHQVPFLDPTPAMRERVRAGEAVYGDHWTPLGHRVVAEYLDQVLEDFLSDRPVGFSTRLQAESQGH